MALVFCSGLKRSGSTWSYNVARLLLTYTTDPARLISGYAGERDHVEKAIAQTQGKCDNLLLKFHYPTDSLVSMVVRGDARNIYTVRHPLEALASELNFFGASFDQALANIELGLQWMDIWRDQPGTLFIRFVDIIETPQEQVEHIARHLEINVGNETIRTCTEETSYQNMKRLADELAYAPEERLVRVGGMTYDRVTLLHVGHAPKGASRNWRAVLDEHQTETACAHLQRWIKVYDGEQSDSPGA